MTDDEIRSNAFTQSKFCLLHFSVIYLLKIQDSIAKLEGNYQIYFQEY